MAHDLFLAFMQGLPFGWGGGRKRLRRKLLAAGTDVILSEIHGYPVQMHLDNTSESKFLMSPKSYNRKEIDFLRRHLNKDGAVFFDIGANGGIYSFAIAAQARHALKIVAIEPNPDLCKRLDHNLHKLNRFSDKDVEINIVETALGAESGELFLNTQSGLGTAHIQKSVGDSGYKVAIQPLYQLCQSLDVDHISALKIDVEGYEHIILAKFFEDAPQALWPQVIVIEHLDEKNASFLDALYAWGYGLHKKTRNNLLLERRGNP